MDFQTLHFLAEERFTLYAIPALLSGLLQLVGEPNPPENLGLRLGHASKTIRQFLKASLNIFNSRSKITFPTRGQWKSLFTFQFIHHDLGHFVGNYITLAQAIMVMKFPSWGATRGWRRGGFVSFLLTSGSIAGALAMDAMSGKGIFNLSHVSKKISSAVQQTQEQLQKNSPQSQSKNGSSTIGSNISAYVPEQVTAAVGWISDQLPASNWHNDDSKNNNSVPTATTFASDDDDGGSNGVTSKISQFLGFGDDGENGSKSSNVIMMGISSAAFAVVGYNVTFSPRADSMASAAMLVGHTVLSELTRRSENNNNKNDLSSSGLDLVMTAHVAHLGGFFWGVLVGYVCRRIEKRRRDGFAFRLNNNGEGEMFEDDRGNRGRVLGVRR